MVIKQSDLVQHGAASLVVPASGITFKSAEPYLMTVKVLPLYCVVSDDVWCGTYLHLTACFWQSGDCIHAAGYQ